MKEHASLTKANTIDFYGALCLQETSEEVELYNVDKYGGSILESVHYVIW
jgi:hypothetical protein